MNHGMGRGIGWGVWLFLSLVGKKCKYFLELPFRASVDTVCAPAVGRCGKGWRTDDVVHLYSRYPVGLGEADIQCPHNVKFCWRNVEKSLMLRTQWTDRWVHGGATGWVHVGEFGRVHIASHTLHL